MEIKPLYIKHGKRPNVLLLGNGINKAFGFASWDELIESIRTKEFSDQERENIKHVPYPLQPVILTGDHVGTQMKVISKQLSELRAPDEEETLLRMYAELPLDAILTANYTYEVEKSLDPKFKSLPGRACKWRHLAYSECGKYNLRQLHTFFYGTDGLPPVWHIHGEAARHDTMVLGHYYYGKGLAKMQQYISPLITRYKESLRREQDMAVYSWLDYFMLGDVYIVGLGMALAELDLWWLLNCKKRNFPGSKIVLYKPDIKPEEKLLAEAYDVVVKDGGKKKDYQEYYKGICKELQQVL